jgi:hypothetical protein
MQAPAKRTLLTKLSIRAAEIENWYQCKTFTCKAIHNSQEAANTKRNRDSLNGELSN